MMGSKQDAAARLDLAQALDDLALRVVVSGAAALTCQTLNTFKALAVDAGVTSLATEVEVALQQVDAQLLKDKEAHALIQRMQALLPAPAGEPTQPRSSEQEASANTPLGSPPPAPAPTLVFEEDPEMLAGFVMEATEHLAAIEEKILLLERDPSLMDAVHAVFRAFHTIKGLAGFLGLSGVQAVAHEVETLLDYARKGKISITPEIVDLVLESSEYLKEEVAHVDARINNTALPTIRDNVALLQALSIATGAAAEGKTIRRRAAPAVLPPPAVIPPQSPTSLSLPVAAPGVVAKTPADVPAAAPPPGPGPVAVSVPAPPAQKSRAETSTQSIRVETAKLDRLMDMVGEMVIAQSILTNHPRWKVHQDARLAGDMSRLVRITGEVQKCAMSMRMMPIGPLFQKNAKMVRDLSRRNGKQVNLILSGESTELDKTIAEELSDPLLHMIRNALDHGIETPGERAAAGKSPEASLRISAEHEAGQIVISIADDGRGLDTKRIFAKAVQNGLVDANTPMTEDEIFHLIFEPGFSTAEKITDISGRGVGMDVVRKHVETLRGRIDIRSELGKGTTFFIRVPLTLAIIEGLVVVVGKHRYIIPVFSVREMFQPTQEMLFTVQGKDEMILMRGELLPVVRLYRRFDIQPRTENVCQGLMVVCEFSGKQFCLFVDDLSGRQEIVIKSLDETFKNTRGLAGCAILGDGRIGLILDVKGIFQGADETSERAAA